MKVYSTIWELVAAIINFQTYIVQFKKKEQKSLTDKFLKLVNTNANSNQYVSSENLNDALSLIHSQPEVREFHE